MKTGDAILLITQSSFTIFLKRKYAYLNGNQNNNRGSFHSWLLTIDFWYALVDSYFFTPQCFIRIINNHLFTTTEEVKVVLLLASYTLSKLTSF